MNKVQDPCLDSSQLGDSCPECRERGMIQDPEVGELYCPNCGFTVRDGSHLSSEGIIHAGSPSFPFLYDKGLPTTFRPSDVRDERALEFRRLASVDRAVKGIRFRESSILNVCRRVLPLLEQNLGTSASGMIDRVKTRIAEIVAKSRVPHVSGIYPALVCYALLDLGIRVDKKKVLQTLTKSNKVLLQQVPFRYLPEKGEWICSFKIRSEDPVDHWNLSIRAKTKDGRLRGNVTFPISILSTLSSDEVEGGEAVSRSVEGRLRLHVRANRTAYARGNDVSLSACVSSSDGTLQFTDQDVTVQAYVYSGGRFESAWRAFWDLRNQTGIPAPKISAKDFLKQCRLLTLGRLRHALETVEDLEHIARLYGKQVQARQLAAVAAHIHLPEYSEADIAKEFGIGVSALTSKEELLQGVYGCSVDELVLNNRRRVNG